MHSVSSKDMERTTANNPEKSPSQSGKAARWEAALCHTSELKIPDWKQWFRCAFVMSEALPTHQAKAHPTPFSVVQWSSTLLTPMLCKYRCLSALTDASRELHLNPLTSRLPSLSSCPKHRLSFPIVCPIVCPCSFLSSLFLFRPWNRRRNPSGPLFLFPWSEDFRTPSIASLFLAPARPVSNAFLRLALGKLMPHCCRPCCATPWTSPCSNSGRSWTGGLPWNVHWDCRPLEQCPLSVTGPTSPPTCSSLGAPSGKREIEAWCASWSSLGSWCPMSHDDLVPEDRSGPPDPSDREHAPSIKTAHYQACPSTSSS